MKITHWRDSKGKYAKRSFFNKLIRFIWGITRLALIVFIVGLLISLVVKAHKTNKTAPESIITAKNDGLTDQQRQDLEKQYELKKEETVLMNRKATLDADYKAKSMDIENQLQVIRQQELSFPSAQSR